MRSQKSGPLSALTNSLRRRGAPSGGVWGRHYGGRYWSSTLRGPVICESRLELAGLLFADFEPSVRHIVAQPFFLGATVDQKVCKHVPDHLLITDEALSLWMSSLSVAMADPKVAFTFEWTRELSRPVVGVMRWELSRRQSNWVMSDFFRLEAARKN